MQNTLDQLSKPEQYRQLLAAGYTYEQVARLYDVAPDSVRRVSQRVELDPTDNKITIGGYDYTVKTESHQNSPNFNDNDFRDMNVALKLLNSKQSGKTEQESYPRERITADNLRETVLEYLGTTANLEDIPERSNPTKRRKVVIVADTHGKPSPALTAALVNEQADIYAHGGDATQQSEASQHFTTDTDQTFPIHDPIEMLHESDPSEFFTETTQDDLAAQRGQFETVLLETRGVWVVVRGNHDDWTIRQAQQLLPKHLWRWVVDPLQLLISYLPKSRVQMFKTPLHWRALDGTKSSMGMSRYLGLIGKDCLISHANFTGANAGDAVRKLYKKMQAWRHIEELSKVTTFVQCHAHKLNLSWESGGAVCLVEPGMGADPSAMNYQIAGYEMKWNPGTVSAVVLEQNNIFGEWETDLQSIRPLFAK